jgi:hypothetical protein
MLSQLYIEENHLWVIKRCSRKSKAKTPFIIEV